MHARVVRSVLLLFLLSALAAGTAQAQAPAQPTPTTATATTATLEVSIAIAESGGQRTMPCGAGGTHFSVAVRNVAATPLNLWNPGCSWGYENLSFEVRETSGTVHAVRKAPHGWNRNAPIFFTLQPKETRVFEVNFASDGWTKPPEAAAPGAKSTVVTMRAVYQVKPDEESRTQGVWTGRAESPWGDYMLTP